MPGSDGPEDPAGPPAPPEALRDSPAERAALAAGLQLALDVRPPLAVTLESFVPGRNRELLAAVSRLLPATAGRVAAAMRDPKAGPAADAPADRMTPIDPAAPAPDLPTPPAAAARLLYVWGDPGCGRTHLLTALAAQGAWWWRPGEDPSRPGLALVDDVEHLSAAAQVALFSRLRVVLTTDAAGPSAPACVAAGPLPPGQLGTCGIRDDVRSRLATGLVYRLHALNDEEMAEALAARARARGATVAEDLVGWMLVHLPRDMGRLAATIDALDAHALARRRPLTVPLLREWLAAGLPEVPPAP